MVTSPWIRWVPLGALLAACGTGPLPEPPAPEQRSQAVSVPTAASAWTRALPWGAGAGQVGLRPTVPELMADGPSAVAVGPDGAAFVLDRRNRRVLRVTASRVRVAATVPADAEDLAVGADGTLAAYSPLKARVHLLRGETPLGVVSVPRVLRGVVGITLGASRQVLLRVAHQETYRLGSPAVPRSLAAVLHSKREGAFRLADGRAVAVRRRADGLAELLVIRPGERATVTRRHRLPEPVLAARVMGVAGSVACLRLERPGPVAGGRISVSRRLVCLDVDSGATRLARDLPLPDPDLYLPRRELAVGGSPARVAFLRPTHSGLSLQVWPLQTGRVDP